MIFSCQYVGQQLRTVIIQYDMSVINPFTDHIVVTET